MHDLKKHEKYVANNLEEVPEGATLRHGLDLPVLRHHRFDILQLLYLKVDFWNTLRYVAPLLDYPIFKHTLPFQV